MSGMAVPAPAPPDEAAFYAAWFGKLWPRYARRLEPGWNGRGFERRAAFFPLWLSVPGLWRPLSVFVVAVLAVCLAVVVGTGTTQPEVVLVLGFLVLVFWPVALLALAYLAWGGEVAGLLAALPAAMLAGSVVLGVRTPRWLVAEARRRWARHSAGTPAGAAPKPPRSLTATHPWHNLAFLAAIGVTTYYGVFAEHQDDHERMYRAAMRSDLRNLVTSQEAFLADSGRYAGDLATLGFESTYGVTLEIVRAGDSGWSALARHSHSEQVCGIFVGIGPAPVAGAEEGQPQCVTPDD